MKILPIFSNATRLNFRSNIPDSEKWVTSPVRIDKSELRGICQSLRSQTPVSHRSQTPFGNAIARKTISNRFLYFAYLYLFFSVSFRS
ncbi:hypothetical protein QUF80_23000 [Desulfococcaceae bacterium HSG8]|nr:hypothetical protein [Desulfococcaceae bacterium HSG8]